MQEKLNNFFFFFFYCNIHSLGSRDKLLSGCGNQEGKEGFHNFAGKETLGVGGVLLVFRQNQWETACTSTKMAC